MPVHGWAADALPAAAADSQSHAAPGDRSHLERNWSGKISTNWYFTSSLAFSYVVIAAVAGAGKLCAERRPLTLLPDGMAFAPARQLPALAEEGRIAVQVHTVFGSITDCTKGRIELVSGISRGNIMASILSIRLAAWSAWRIVRAFNG